MQNIIAYLRGPNPITKKRVWEVRQHAAVTIHFPAGKRDFKHLVLSEQGISKGVYSVQPFCASEALQGSHVSATAASHQLFQVSGSQPS